MGLVIYKKPVTLESFEAAKSRIEIEFPGAVYGKWVPDAAKRGSHPRLMNAYANRQDKIDSKRVALIKEVP